MDFSPPPLCPEDLLERSACVRRLAAELVSDPSLREDVAQQTLLEALSGRTAVKDLGAWIARLVRNTAFAVNRSERRRREHERRLPAPEPAVPTDLLVAEAELHQRIVRATLELDEPCRSTVLLRYFRGLSAEEIASHEGVPAATVRSRLKRGLDRLRERFAAEQRTERGAWLALLLPFPRPESAAVASVSLVTVGGIAMSLKTVLLSLAAIAVATPLVLVGTGLIPRREPTPVALESEPAAPPAAAPVAAKVDPAKPAEPDRAEVKAEAGSAALPWQTGVLRGRVREVTGRPLEGIKVTLEPLQSSSALEALRDAHPEPFGQATAPCSTDAEGRYAFPAVPAGGPWWLAAARGDYVRQDRVLMVPAGEVVEADLTLVHGGTVAGRVVDEAGRPVSGAEVTSYPAGPVFSSADGAFLLCGLRDGQKLWAKKPGLAMKLPHCRVAVRPGDTRQGVEVLMVADRPIRGAVHDQSGRPISNAKLTCYPFPDGRADTIGDTRTDEWGDFVLAPVPGQGLFEVDVQASGYATVNKERVQAGATIEIVLPSAGSIEVVPVDAEEGTAVRPQRLLLQEARSGQDGEDFHTCAYFSPEDAGIEVAEGRYAVPCEGSGRCRVVVEADGLRPGFTPAFDLNGRERIGPIVVHMESGADLRGLVLSGATGKPVQGALVALLVTRPAREASARVIQGVNVRDDFEARDFTSTSEAGEFAFDGLQDGRYCVRVSGEHLAGVVTEGIEVARDRKADVLRIILPIGGSIRGTVIGKDGKPLPGQAVVAHQANGLYAFAVTDDAGGLCLAPLAPGRYRVELGDATQNQGFSTGVHVIGDLGIPGPDPRLYSVVVNDGQATTWNLDLRTAFATVTGTVLVRHDPREGLSVALRRIIQSGAGDQADMLAKPLHTLTRAGGMYQIEDVPPGTYDLTIFAPASGPCLARERIELKGGEQRTVDFDLELCRARGFVVDAGTGVPVEGATVTASRTTGGDQPRAPTATSDSTGAFELDLLDPGDVVFEAQTDWGASARQPVTLSPGSEQSVRLLVSPGGAIRARVLPEGWLAWQIQVELVEAPDGTPHALRQTVEDDGTLLLAGIRPGAYELRVRQRFLDRSASALLTVRAGETLQVELTLAAKPEGR